MAEEAAMAEAERVNLESFPPPTQPTPSDDEDLEEKEEEKEDEKENNEEKNEEKEEKPEGKKGPKSKAKAKPKAKATMKRPSSNVVAKRPASSTKKAKTGDAAAPEEPAEPEETEEPVEGEKKNKEDKSEKKADKNEKKADKSEKKEDKSEKKEKEKKEKDKDKKEKDAEKAAAKAKAAEYEKMREEQKKAKAAAKAKAKSKSKLTHTQRDEERAQALKIDSDKEAEEEKEEKGEEKVEELRDPRRHGISTRCRPNSHKRFGLCGKARISAELISQSWWMLLWRRRAVTMPWFWTTPLFQPWLKPTKALWAKSALLIFLCLLQIFMSSSILCLLQICLQISENSSDLICDVFPTCFCIFLFPLFHTIQERCRNAQSFNAGKVGQLWRCFDPSLARWRRLCGSWERSWFLRFQDFGGDSKQWCQINH